MPTAEESVYGGNASQEASALGAGIGTISQGQAIIFRLYTRRVLPADGFVFWVRNDVLAPGASALNTSALNSFALNAGSFIVARAPTDGLKVQPASLHHTTLNSQDEAESYSVQRFVLTTQQPIDHLADVAPDQMWIGAFGPYRLAFSQRTGFYNAANTYHYRGDALYPALASQVIEFPGQLSFETVVSNSLPIWLSLQPPTYTLYPSYLVPDNLPPPYGVVHIGDEDTSVMQFAPYIDPATGTRWGLARDRVKVTLYGVRSNEALDFVQAVWDFTERNPYTMGMMNSPTVRDAKRAQTEFSVIAQKKIISFEVSYQQVRIRDCAQQTIKTVFIDSTIDGAGSSVVGPIAA